MHEDMQHLVLIDFGNSANLYEGKMLKRLTGTIYYMAPEVFKNKYNEKVDIWSVGVLIFRMLSGYYPF